MLSIRTAIVLMLLMVNSVCSAQNTVIKIWQDSIPGAITNSTVKEDTFYFRNGNRIRNVTEPDITVFLPKENFSGAAVLICPGGGYERLTVESEGTDVARWFNSLGIAAFYLKYRLPDDRIMKNKTVGPLQDVQEAVRVIRRKADEFKISPDKIGVIGFSAGGHLASTLAVHYDEKVYESDKTSARPDFTILIYPVISMNDGLTHGGSREHLLGKNPDQKLIVYFSNDLQVNKDTPPAFLVHASDDKTVPVQNSIIYFQALKKNDVPSELHIYEKGGHGFGLAPGGGSEANWPAACEKWLRVSGYVK